MSLTGPRPVWLAVGEPSQLQRVVSASLLIGGLKQQPRQPWRLFHLKNDTLGTESIYEIGDVSTNCVVSPDCIGPSRGAMKRLEMRTIFTRIAE